MPSVINTILGRRTAKRGKKHMKGKHSRKIVRRYKKATPSRSIGTAKDVIDVRSPAEVGKLMEMLKKNKVVVVLVYADWCGHCQTFKKDIWEKLSGMPNRKVPLAAVNETMYDKTPMSNVKIDGYPSVLMMGNDMQAATFKDETGNPTNSIPNARDLEAMKTIVSADPEEAIGASGAVASAPSVTDSATPSRSALPSTEAVTPSASGDPEASEDTHSRVLSESASAQMEEAGQNAIENVNMGLQVSPNGSSKLVTNPPNAEDDIMASMEPSLEDAKALNSLGATLNASSPASGSQEGGSLYYAMLEAARELAVPAALTGSAIYLDKRMKAKKRMTARRRRAARAARGTAKKLRGGIRY